MSQFTRTLSAILSANGMSQAELVIASGLAPSVLSRLMKGDRAVYANHAAAIIRALPSEADRRHCLRAFILDECPEEYREQIGIHFGVVEEERPPNKDELRQNLDKIEAAATYNNDLKNLLANLASIIA